MAVEIREDPLCQLFVVVRASLYLSLIGLALPGAAPATPKAALALSNASATLAQTSDPDWTLEKSGEFDPATSTVTWTITATEERTTTDRLVVAGAFTLTNLGGAERDPAVAMEFSGRALQRRDPTWRE